MILDFLKAKGYPGNFSVLDFSSSCVRAVIVDASHLRESPSLCVVGLGEEPYPNGVVIGSVIGDIAKFKDTARLALKKASFDCGFNPRPVVFSLSGEFSKAVSTRIQISRKSQTRLSGREWSDYEKKIQELLINEAETDGIAVTGSLETEVEIVEKVLVSCRMSGKDVPPPPGNVDFSQIDLSYLITFTQKDTNALLTDVAASLSKKELYKTARIVNFIRLLIKSGEPLNVIFIDLDLTSTDVGVVLDSFLTGVRTIPFGEEAFSDPEGYDDWLSMLCTALDDFEGIKSFPPRLVLCGGRLETSATADALKAFPWQRKFPFVTAPEVTLLSDLLDASFVGDKTGRLKQFLTSAAAAASFTGYVQSRT